MRGIIQKPMLGDECMSDGTNPADRNNVLKLLFNEGSGGQIFDLSGNGNTGTLFGATWGAAKYGPGIFFGGDNSNDRIEIPTISLSVWTMNIWIKASAFVSSWIMPIGQKDDLANNYFIARKNDGTYRVYHAGTSSDCPSAPSAPVLNVWELWTVVSDGTNYIFYINGIYQGQVGGSGTFIFDVIGNVWNGYYDIDGVVDNCLIYNRILSASEIALLYREPFADLGPRRLVYAPVAGVALPVYMHHYRQAS